MSEENKFKKEYAFLNENYQRNVQYLDGGKRIVIGGKKDLGNDLGDTEPVNLEGKVEEEQDG